MVIGRRTNVLLGNDSLLYLPENVTKTARQRGQLFTTDAEDYFFIAFNNFPWHLIRDVVIGRPGYDNYLVGMAIKQNVTVVDATATLLAFHQTDKEGNYAGGHMNNDGGFNRIIIGQFKYYTGLTTSAHYVTRYTIDKVCNRTLVVVERRHRARIIATRSPFRQVTSASSHSSHIRQVVSTPTRTHRRLPKYQNHRKTT